MFAATYDRIYFKDPYLVERLVNIEGFPAWVYTGGVQPALAQADRGAGLRARFRVGGKHVPDQGPTARPDASRWAAAAAVRLWVPSLGAHEARGAFAVP